MPYLVKGSRPDINNGPEVTQIVPTFWSQHLFKFNSNNGPSQAIPILAQMEDTPAQVSQLWSGGVPYLNKGCRPDFNNGLGGDSNSGLILVPWHLFESESNNGPSLGHSNLVSDAVYISSSLLLMIS